MSLWERKCVRLRAPLHNCPLPSKPTATNHLQTSYCALMSSPLFPTAGVTNIAAVTRASKPTGPLIPAFALIIFAPSDATLQPRQVANRQYYTLPNNGAGVERRTSAPPVSVSVESPRFHPHAKGKNIRLDGQLRRATRKNSFCNGITFSHRPVHLYEKVCVTSLHVLIA